MSTSGKGKILAHREDQLRTALVVLREHIVRHAEIVERSGLQLIDEHGDWEEILERVWQGVRILTANHMSLVSVEGTFEKLIDDPEGTLLELDSIVVANAFLDEAVHDQFDLVGMLIPDISGAVTDFLISMEDEGGASSSDDDETFPDGHPGTYL